MKKFLSLVLALVMTMSLVTISAGAKDFTDDASINYKEAVGVMSELKIVDGTTDGAFNPKGNLTRGAAAKIICNMILGPTTAAALHTTSAPFPDVPADHVFAGYIAYCVEQGIISGYTDGTFKPANPLTGYAFLKMLLGALGYDQYVEGYAVPNWSVNVAKQAIAIGLDDGNDNFDGTKTVNREEALLYAFNTMKANMVEYTQKTEIKTGDAVVTVSGGRRDQTNSTEKNFDKDVTDDAKLQFVEKYFPKVTVKDDMDAFKRPTNLWKNNNKTIGEYVVKEDAHYEADTTSKTIYTDLDLDSDDAYSFTVISDGETGTALDLAKKGEASKVKVSAKDATYTGNGSDIYVYESEGKIVVINTYLLQVAADYNAKKETLTLKKVTGDAGVNYPTIDSLELSSDTFAGLDKFEKDDYVTVTIAEGVIKSIAACEPVKATVTEYVHGESVTAGEEYKYSAASKHNADNGEKGIGYTLKEEYSLYLDEEGNVLYAKGATATDKYVYVVEFSKHSSSSKANVEAYAYFTDGTEAEIKVSKVDGEAVKTGNIGENNALTVKDENNATVSTYAAGKGYWFTYTEKNGKYELKKAGQTEEFGVTTGAKAIVDYSKDHTEICAEETTYAIDGTAKTNFIILESDGDVRTYTGIKNVPDIYAGTTTKVNIQKNNETYANNVWIELGNGKISGGSNSSDILFLLKLEKQGNDADNDEYYRYSALKNGEKTTVKVDKTIANSWQKAGTLAGDVEYSGKNYVVDMLTVTGAVADNRKDFSFDLIEDDTDSKVIVDLTGNTLEIGAQANNDYFMADEHSIYVIDMADASYDTYDMDTFDFYVGEGDIDMDEDDAIYGILGDDGYTALYIVLNFAGDDGFLA